MGDRGDLVCAWHHDQLRRPLESGEGLALIRKVEDMELLFFSIQKHTVFPMDNDNEWMILDFRFGNALVQND